MEFFLFTECSIENEDRGTVGKCLKLADTLSSYGDDKIKNAFHVSYLESLPREGYPHDRLMEMMSVELRQAWAEVLTYLSMSPGDQILKNGT